MLAFVASLKLGKEANLRRVHCCYCTFSTKFYVFPVCKNKTKGFIFVWLKNKNYAIIKRSRWTMNFNWPVSKYNPLRKRNTSIIINIYTCVYTHVTIYGKGSWSRIPRLWSELIHSSANPFVSEESSRRYPFLRINDQHLTNGFFSTWRGGVGYWHIYFRLESKGAVNIPSEILSHPGMSKL